MALATSSLAIRPASSTRLTGPPRATASTANAPARPGACRSASSQARRRALDLDSVYGARVVLETLGASVTMPSLTDDDLDEAEALLDRMREVGEQDDFDTWQEAHRAFHRRFVNRAGEPLLRLIVVQAERSERYLAPTGSTSPAPGGRRERVPTARSSRPAVTGSSTGP
jgi:DNA-binding FadR family transcriptional regulator